MSELKVHIELTRFVQPEKIEIDANERAVNEKSQYCFFVCTTFDSFLNDLYGKDGKEMSIKDGGFSQVDLLQDVDAYNISRLYNLAETKLYAAFEDYYNVSKHYKRRYHIFKPKILVGTCDCRIVRWLYVAYYHGMVVALHYLKLSPYNRIVECGSNLAHTSAYRVHYLTVLVCACYLIAVVSCDRADSLVNRELLTRIYDTAVYQAACVLYIGCTSCCRAAEICRKTSQIILNLREFLL